MNLHLERRLEVLAREIAASKTPKIDAAANAVFAEAARKHEHKAPPDWARKINGAAGAPASAACKTGNRSVGLGAAPPSAQKFKVGDRVRAIASFENWHAVGDTGVVLEVDDGLIVVRFDPSETTSAGLLEFGTACYSERFELIPSPAQEPAATPVALGDGWVAHRPGDAMPVPRHAIVHCKLQNGALSTLPPMQAAAWNWGFVAAYKVLA